MIPEALYLVIWFCSEPLLFKSHFSKLSKHFFLPSKYFCGIEGKASLLPLYLPLAIRGSCCHSLRSRSKLLRKVNHYKTGKKIKLHSAPRRNYTWFFPPFKKRYNSNIASTFLIWHTAMKLVFQFIKNSNSIRGFFLNTFYRDFIYFLKIQGSLWNPEF